MHLFILFVAAAFSSQFTAPNAGDFTITPTEIPKGLVIIKDIKVEYTGGATTEVLIDVKFGLPTAPATHNANTVTEKEFTGITFDNVTKKAEFDADLSDFEFPAVESKVKVYIKLNGGEYPAEAAALEITIKADVNTRDFTANPNTYKKTDLLYGIIDNFKAEEKAGNELSGTEGAKGYFSLTVPTAAAPTLDDGVEVELDFVPAVEQSNESPNLYKLKEGVSLATLVPTPGSPPATIYFYLKEAEWNTWSVFGAPISVTAGFEFKHDIAAAIPLMDLRYKTLPAVVITAETGSTLKGTAGAKIKFSNIAPGGDFTEEVFDEFNVTGDATPATEKYTLTAGAKLANVGPVATASGKIYIYLKENGDTKYSDFGATVNVGAAFEFKTVPNSFTATALADPVATITVTPFGTTTFKTVDGVGYFAKTAPGVAPVAGEVEVTLTAGKDAEDQQIYTITNANLATLIPTELPGTIYLYIKEDGDARSAFGFGIAVTDGVLRFDSTLTGLNHVDMKYKKQAAVEITPSAGSSFTGTAGAKAVFSARVPNATEEETIEGVEVNLTAAAGKYTTPAELDLSSLVPPTNAGKIYLYLKEKEMNKWSQFGAEINVTAGFTFALNVTSVAKADLDAPIDFLVTSVTGGPFKAENGDGYFSKAAPGEEFKIAEAVAVVLTAKLVDTNQVYTIAEADLSTLKPTDDSGAIYLYVKEKDEAAQSVFGAKITVGTPVVTKFEYTLNLTTITDKDAKAGKLEEVIITPKTDVVFKATTGAKGIFSAKAPSAAAQEHTGVDVDLEVVAAVQTTPAKYKIAKDTADISTLVPATLPGKIYFYIKESGESAWSVFGAPISITSADAAMGVTPLLTLLAATLLLFVSLF